MFSCTRIFDFLRLTWDFLEQVLVFHRSLLFDQTFQKLRPLSATIQENGKFTFLSVLEVCLFFWPLFLLIFVLFWALIFFGIKNVKNLESGI